MDLQWVVGTGIAIVGLVVGAIGGVIARDRALTTMIAQGDDKLHERLNRLRDDLSDNYVRRVDLDAHMARIDNSLRDIREDLKENTRTMSSLLTHIKSSAP